MNHKLEAVIFDWAGTTVDFGCFAPTGVFMEVFRQKGIEITLAEARGPMGMHKKDHIRTILQQPRIAGLWLEKYGHPGSEEEIEEMFQNFIPLQLSVIEQYSAIVPEVPEAVELIRSYGMKMGSTTGYNRAMMDILEPAAARQGYKPDAVVCASDVPAGRPAPWMAFRNAEMLGVYPMKHILKIGDTISDIREGINAGMWSVGVILSSNEMGLTQDEINSLSPEVLEKRKDEISRQFYQAGADYVIGSLAETEYLIKTINLKLAMGKQPGSKS